VEDFNLGKLLEQNLATVALVALAVVLVFYAVERVLFLHSGKIKPQQFLDGVISLLRSNRYNEAMTVCENSPGVAALIVKTALVFRNKPPDEVRHAVSSVALLEIPLLERRISSIGLIAKIAPLMSFVGVLHIFAGALRGLNDAAAYFSASAAVGLMQRVLSLAAFGLAVNVFGSLAYHFLYGRVRRLIYDMEWSCNEILNYMAIGKEGENADD
jgi:biopolymer transport protein ExbB